MPRCLCAHSGSLKKRSGFLFISCGCIDGNVLHININSTTILYSVWVSLNWTFVCKSEHFEVMIGLHLLVVQEGTAAGGYSRLQMHFGFVEGVTSLKCNKSLMWNLLRHLHVRSAEETGYYYSNSFWLSHHPVSSPRHPLTAVRNAFFFFHENLILPN